MSAISGCILLLLACALVANCAASVPFSKPPSSSGPLAPAVEKALAEFGGVVDETEPYPVTAKQGWVLSEVGDSCRSACASQGGKCYTHAHNLINSATAMDYVASLLGVSCDETYHDSSDFPYDPMVTGTTCFYYGSGSNCSATYEGNALYGPGQRFCCCSSAEGACPVGTPTTPTTPTTLPTTAPTTPTTAPTTAPVSRSGWVLSASHGTCEEACSSFGTTCNVNKQAAVNSSDTITFVAGLFGLSCDPDYSPEPWDPNYTDPFCYYGDSVSDCTSPSNGQRFCCCSHKAGDCPSSGHVTTTQRTTQRTTQHTTKHTTSGPMPGVDGWVLSGLNENCISACASVGATCEPSQQNAINSVGVMQYVGVLLGVDCDQVYHDSGEDEIPYDPMITGSTCFYYGRSSDCTSSYPGYGAYGPGQRFCCCASGVDACPTGG